MTVTNLADLAGTSITLGDHASTDTVNAGRLPLTVRDRLRSAKTRCGNSWNEHCFEFGSGFH